MKVNKNWLIFLLIFGLAALLRLYGIKWDQGNYFHPDERFLAMVTNDLHLPASFSEYLDPNRSPLNPYNSKFSFFVYGTFPVNLNKAIVNIFNSDDYSKIGFCGRLLSAIFDLGSLVFVFLTVILWERFYKIDSRIKYYAGFFYSIAVLPIQHAHFFTVDSFLNFFMLSSFYFAVRACFYNRSANACVSGILFGFALGTKISAVYILPLLLLFLFLEQDAGKGFKDFLKSLFKSLPLKIFSTVVFILLAYFSLRFADPRFFESGNIFKPAMNPKLINNIKELAASGNFGEGLPSPPSVQWIRVPPIVFALKNIAFFGLGLPFFLLSIAGVSYLYKTRSREVLLIALWALCFFIYQSSQFVKTMRYFYILYPFFSILAACGTIYVLKKWYAFKYKRTAFSLLFLAILAWPYSFMQIYTKPHSRVMASEWIYKNIPENKLLAHIHWDDYLPVYLPDIRKNYRSSELPVFWSDDDPNKWGKIDDELRIADYIVFTSNRGYGSIMPLPDKYPRMSGYFRKLFNNQTEFKLVADIASYPTLNLGFIEFPINDQWAEEAFSVYDHPRITIFQKNPNGAAPISIRNEDFDSGFSSLSSTIIFFFLIQILSLSVLPLLAYILPKYPDAGYGISKTAGFFLFGLISWIIPIYTGLKIDLHLCYAIFLLVVAAGYFKAGNVNFFRNFYIRFKSHIWRVEIIFTCAFLFFLGIRWANPEIYWGEKPMDSSLLHYFVRTDSLPPTDPWSSGTVMRYYYLGSLMFANLLKIAGISAGIGYNLSIAVIPAFCIASLYSLFLVLVRKPGFAIFSAISVVAISNLEIINLVFFVGKSVNFDTFWASTRLFNSPAFTEYPLWSYLFADLHAHVVAQAICAIILALVPAFLSTKDDKISRYQTIAYGTCLASLMLLNSWDFLTYMLLTFFAFLIKAAFPLKHLKYKETLLQLVKEAGLILIAGLVITVPYQLTANPASGVYWGWNGEGEYNFVNMIFRHFGTWIIISFLGAMLAINKFSKSVVRITEVSVVTLIALIPIALGLVGYSKGLIPPPWGILILSSILTLTSLLSLILSKNKSLLTKYACLTFLCFSLVLGIIEMLFLIDRMNSIFKFYYSLWMIVATSAMAFSALFFAKHSNTSILTKIFTLSGRSVAACLLFICAIGSLLNIYVGVTYIRTNGPRFTLDGQAYLKNSDPDEFLLIKWLNRNIIGDTVMLEAQGAPYGPFSRIVMHTGISTVIGWEHHIKQRGTKSEEVVIRSRDVAYIYKTNDPLQADKIMDKYGVTLIVVSKLERETYPADGIRKFENNPNLFPLLFKSGEAAIYTRSKAIESSPNHDKLEIKWK